MPMIINLALAVSCIPCLGLALILLMLLGHLANSWLTLAPTISLLLINSSDTSILQRISSFFTMAIQVNMISTLIQTLTGLVILEIIIPCQGMSLRFLVAWLHGVLRSSLLWLYLVPRENIWPSLMLQRKLYGFNSS